MKKSTLSLKELLTDFKKDNNFKIPLGIDEKDNVVTYNLDEDRSLLVAGATGIGKTNLFNDIILNILMYYNNTKVIILDSQKINYNTYSNLCEVIKDEKEIINKIKEIRHLFEDKVKTGNKENIVVLIDEIYEILSLDPSVKDDLNYLLELSYMEKINLIVSTDSIEYEDIKDLFDRDNISKFSFYLTSRGEYNTFLNAVVKDSLQNDGIYIGFNKESARVTVPLIEDNEIEKVVKFLEDNK